MKKLTKVMLTTLLALTLALATAVAPPLAPKAAADGPAHLCPGTTNGSDPYVNTHLEVSGNLYTLWFKVSFYNSPGSATAYNVKATLTYLPANQTLIPGSNGELGVVHLGNIPANSAHLSTDDFRFVLDWGHPQFPNDVLIWQVEYDDAATGGNHYVVPNVMKYCGETINPDTTVTITSSAPKVETGDNVTLTITETNTGNTTLRNPSVVLDAPLSITLTKASASFVGGDYIVYHVSGHPDVIVDNNGILDPGETWTWSLNSGALTETTTFTATGHGIDPLGNDITFSPTFPKEQASVPVTVISPDTLVTITSSPKQVHAGDNVTLTVTEQNTGDVPLTSPKVNVDNGVGDLVWPPSSGDDGNKILDVGETWTWTVPNVTINADTTFTAIGYGIDPLGKNITVSTGYDNEQDEETVTVVSPGTLVTITSSASQVPYGGSVTLTIKEDNTGYAALTNPYVILDPGAIKLDTTSPGFSGDTSNPGVLDLDETWTWSVSSGSLTATTMFTATGHGTDATGTDITPLNGYDDEQAMIPVTVIPPPPPPGISITKAANKHTVGPGQSVTYTYVVKNTGGVTLTNVTVTDDGGTPNFAGDDFVVGTIATLAPGQQVTLTATVILPQQMCMVVNGHLVTVGQLITQVLPGGNVKVTYIQSRNVVDNTYGTNAVGYSGGHTFSNLVGSDKAEFRFTNGNGTAVLDFFADYISASAAYPSGYGTLGVSGGDGSMVLGSAANVLSVMTSLTQNLIQSPSGYTVNSPTEPNASWDYFDSYTVVVKAAAFGASGFGSVTIPYVHNSPSKLRDNKIVPVPCDSCVTNRAVVTATTPTGGTLTATAQETVCIVVSKPNTRVTITSTSSSTCGGVTSGSKITLTVTEKNTGNVALTNPHVDLAPLGLTLNKASPSFTGGDTNNNGKLDVGETWTWKITGVTVSITTTYIATGHGTDPLGTDVTYPAYSTEQAKVTVTVKPAALATRTPGFWKTHLSFTTYVFTNYLGGDINIGWRDIKNVPDLMGIFWASTSKNSDGSKRTALCQAKEIAAFQAVAAVLNSGLPNGAPLPVSLAYIQTTLGGSDINAIKALGQTLDRYNNSGDRVPIISSQPIGKANPHPTANIKFANCP